MPARNEGNHDYEIKSIMFGQRISEADIKAIDPKFMCTKCHLLLNEPMQTRCGHLLCFGCVQKLLSDSNPVCPCGVTKLRTEEVFPDAFTKRSLMALHLHCPNNDCHWSGSYKELQNHFNCCGHSLIQCVHVQCEEKIKRSLLAQHLEQECNHRLVTCPHCKEELRFIKLEEHLDVSCLAVPLTCKHCGKTDIRRKEMDRHEMMDCEEILAECEFKAIGCNHTKVTRRKELRQHFDDGLIIHVRLLLNFFLELSRKVQAIIPIMEISTMMQAVLEELKQTTGSLSQQFKGLAEKFTSMTKTVTGLERRVGSLESKTWEDRNASHGVKMSESKVSDLSKSLEKVEAKNRKLENELREKTSMIDKLHARLDQIDHAMALATVKLSDMESSNQGQPTTICNGTLLWKIDGFTRKRQEAVGGVKTAIYSPPFYSSQFGYKMCARIYMNGDGFGKGTHLSLFFVLMKGEYDALLPWPFQKKITMMLLDQVNGDHMIDSFRSDPDSSSFQRPKTNMNIASGCPFFMPLDGLSNRAYVREDTMFIKIIVD